MDAEEALKIPELPASMTAAEAGLWAVCALQEAADRHGWGPEELDEGLLGFILLTMMHRRPDEDIVATVRTMLADMRGMMRPKN